MEFVFSFPEKALLMKECEETGRGGALCAVFGLDFGI